MSDDSPGAANPAVDNARVAEYARYDEDSITALNALREKTGIEKASEDAKTRIHKGIADVKTATYGTRSELQTR